MFIIERTLLKVGIHFAFSYLQSPFKTLSSIGKSQIKYQWLTKTWVFLKQHVVNGVGKKQERSKQWNGFCLSFALGWLLYVSLVSLTTDHDLLHPTESPLTCIRHLINAQADVTEITLGHFFSIISSFWKFPLNTSVSQDISFVFRKCMEEKSHIFRNCLTSKIKKTVRIVAIIGPTLG